MTKHVAVAILSCIASWVVVYWLRHRRWARTWGRVPISVWDQLAATMANPVDTPLDANLIIADLNSWLKGEQ